MGLVREQVIGRTLGASRQTDLYFASFTLPDFLNYLLAAGALSIVFIPMFLE
jgi:putative peptidoglycan lipid II flippase